MQDNGAQENGGTRPANERKAILVVGAGDATGGAIARRFSREGHVACFAGFLMGREAARAMLPRGRGSIFFTGATASLRGGSGFSAFAGAKHALRALAQSMARELGPQGIHVAHLIVDAAIDTAFIRDSFPERYALKDRGGIVDPGHIAEALAQQR